MSETECSPRSEILGMVIGCSSARSENGHCELAEIKTLKELREISLLTVHQAIQDMPDLEISNLLARHQACRNRGYPKFF